MLYSIDFGTSNTVVASDRKCLNLPGLSASDSPLIPSLIHFVSPDRFYIGEEVKAQKLDRSVNSFTNFKRGIGQKIGFLPQIDGQNITFEFMGECFLKRILSAFPDRDMVIFTVPIDSYEIYGVWLSNLGETNTRIIDEPTAAALGYGIHEKESRLLVIDFGGGTLDLVLIDLLPPDREWGWGNLLTWYNHKARNLKPSAKVLAKVGQNLGGIDIDRWIIQSFPDVPIDNETLMLAETLKIQLSQQNEAKVNWKGQILCLDQSKLEQILIDRKFFLRLDQALNQIHQQSKVELTTIHRVLMVGGTSLMPLVQNWVKSKFPPDRVECSRPLEAIALGALEAGNWQLEDRLYHDYGIRYWDKRLKQHNWHPLIKKGENYPLDRAVELVLGASVPDQTAIELLIGELGEAATEIVFEQGQLVNRLLEQPLFRAIPLNEDQSTIAPLNPPGQPGTDRVKIEFQVDAQRNLCLTVVDLLTGEKLLQNQPVVKLL